MTTNQPTTPGSPSNTPGGTGTATGSNVPATPTTNPPVPSTPSSTNPSSSSTTTSTTSVTTTTTTVNPRDKYGFQPPNMGGVNEYVKGTFYPFTGGKPNYYWKGLEVGASIPTSPNQIRPIYASESQKAYKHRKEGCSIKFKEGDSLQDFEKRMNKYLLDHGLDTIAYLPDVGSTNMLNIVDSHARFTEEYVRSQAEKYEKKYDEYDKANSVAAREALYNSVNESIAIELEGLLEEGDGFMVAWITLVREIQSLSSDRFDGLKERIRNIKATDYPQQNIKQMSEAYEEAAKELVSAGQYDHNLTKCMINGFIAAGGDNNEDWKAPLRLIKEDLDKALVKLGFHRTKEDESQFMKREKLTYKYICRDVRSRYKKKVESKEWPPGMTPTDNRRLPRQYTAAALAMNMSSKPREVNKKIICYHCGKPGHIKSNCPLLKNSNKFESSDGRTKTKTEKQQRTSWRYTAPKAGEAETITRDKKTFYWCAKCGRWTTTHSTETHTGKSKNNAKNKTKSKTKLEANLATEELDVEGFGAWSTECANRGILTWIRLCILVWTGICLSAITGVLTTILRAANNMYSSIINFYVESPSVWSCITRVIGSTIATAKVLTSMFTINDLWFLAPLSWMIVAYLAIKYSPPSVVERVRITRAGRSQLRMTDFIKYRYRQGKVSQYFKLKSTKKQAKAKRKFMTCETLPERNVKTRAGINDHRMKENTRDVEYAAAIARKDRRRRRHQHQHAHTNKNKLKILLNNHLVNCKLHNGLPNGYKKVSNPTRSYNLQKNAWQVTDPTNDISYIGDNYHHTVRRLPSSSDSSSGSSFESLNRRRRRNLYRRNQMQKDKKVELQLKRQIATAKSVINQAYLDNSDFDYMSKATVLDYLSEYNAFSTALLRPLKSLYAFIMPTTMKVFESAPSEASMHVGRGLKFMVIWDSGASLSITHSKKDFGDTYEPAGTVDILSGICKGLKVEGKGTVKWNIQDQSGTFRTLELPALHVPSCSARLISCSSLLQKYKEESIVMTDSHLVLSGIEGDKSRNCIMVWLNSANNLPTSPAFLPSATKQVAMALNATLNVVDTANINLTPTEKFYLEWHDRLGHPSHPRLMFMFRSGYISNTERNRKLVRRICKEMKVPCKCAACIFAKQTRRPTGSTTIRRNTQVNSLDSVHHYPGSQVSTDHFNTRVRGRLFESYGKTPESQMYSGGVIMVDTATKHIWIKPLVNLDGYATVEAKNDYEDYCLDYGVINKEYLTDLGTPFTSETFTSHLRGLNQIVRYAGTAAHHQNGIAERAIRTIMTTARTMMIHAAIHWHEMADTQLWPMAVQYAVFLYNHLPNVQTGVSPHDRFTKTTWPIKNIHNLHVWGCPVYVLNKSLQDGNKLSRWKARSQRCVYMGLSPVHNENVALVLNPETGAITAQYHVVFDDTFSTIATSKEDLPDFNDDDWVKLFGESQFQYVNDIEDRDDHGMNSWSREYTPTYIDEQRDATVSQAMTRQRPSIPENSEYYPIQRPIQIEQEYRDQQHWSEPLRDDPPIQPSRPQREPQREYQREPQREPQRESITNTVTPQTPRRWTSSDVFNNKSPRTSRVSVPSKQSSQRRTNSLITENQPKVISRYSSKTSTNTPSSTKVRRSARHSQQDTKYVPGETQFVGNNNFAFLASNNNKNPDIFSWDEAMRSEFRDEWLEAAQEEILELEAREAWDEVDVSVAENKQILPGTWTFKLKRAPDGTIKRHKARWCCRGDLQRKEDIDESVYAPVAFFSTLRLFMAITLNLGWTTCTMDFTNAFMQAPLSKPVYLHPPRGFRSQLPGKICLRLKKSHYGLPIAPKKWYRHLVSFLTKTLGFIISKIDECLLYRTDCLIIIYVDDIGIGAKAMKTIDDIVRQLRQGGFDLKKDSTFEEYLGIQFDRKQDGSILMSQPGLINKIITTMGMEKCNPNKTPATKVPLGKDIEGELMNESWDYRSVVGMLLYVSANTRPDISYAVSQVARFSHEPRKTHATALKMIARYLEGTKTKGTIFKPTEELKLECYVDADFAGLYGVEDSSDSVSAKSRSGYIIFLGNCPTLWKSQLQSEVSLSTLESEYVALSQSIRTVLPMQTLLKEIIPTITIPRSLTVNLITTVFEDNNGAISLATTHRVTSRTKHFNIKYHFFWDSVEKGDIVIERINSQEQKADILTKGLTKDTFEKIRCLIQGW